MSSSRVRELIARWRGLGVRGRGFAVAGVVVALVTGIVLIRLLDPDAAVSTTATGSSSVAVSATDSERPAETPSSVDSVSDSGDFASGGSPRADESSPAAGDASSARSGPATDSVPVTVHVVGAVAAAGLYTLTGTARVDAAISAAGGALPSADIAQINLARRVVDGEQIRVPAQGETVVPASGGASGVAGSGDTPPASGPISLSQATAEQLDALPRIGPALAARIIEWRTSNGPFRSVDDLARVSGIGPKMIVALRGKVTP